MSFIAKPKITHPGMPKNSLGLTARDYEGAMSTLCAGCGHDSITAAITQAIFELAIPPERLAKMSGIGCSSKTTAYFVGQAHGINSVHGRMPAVATGANVANRDLYYVGVSGDGDTLSIGLGQFAHAIRRNLDMLYVIENNGVYGLTKGQFSASADLGSKAKRGEVNAFAPIDPVLFGMTLGASFVARGFSGDKAQLVPLLKAGLMHEGFALIDVISPCVTFNDHEGSTKSYAYTRKYSTQVISADYVPKAAPITVAYEPGTVVPVEMHDGSHVLLHKVATDYDPTDRPKALAYLQAHRAKGEIVTGLLYIDETRSDFHGITNTSATPLVNLPMEKLIPGDAALKLLQKDYA
jgi:2-oxoglutarate ferredoxin oxidoreductase subunit beta